MSKITKYSFFLTVFAVSLVWLTITLMILMFHEDHVSRRTIWESLEMQKRLESADHFKDFHQVGQNHKADQDKITPVQTKGQNVKINEENIDDSFEKAKKAGVLAPAENIEPQLNIINENNDKNEIEADSKLKFEPQEEKAFIPPGSEWERLNHLDVIAEENAPGEMGKPVRINKTALDPEQRRLHDKLFKLNSFNQYVSDKISYHRRLADIRNQECKAKVYPADLPNTSVIICLHNEAWSVLLRTVHSVLDRSPEHLIHEIILVDDFSDLEHLKKPLDDYMSTLKKVKVLHTKKREGLVRARLLGYSISTGDTLTFLDSHIECFPGWLEPLLDRIKKNSSTVVAPLIPFISDQTFSTQKSVGALVARGGFDILKLSFIWNNIKQNELGSVSQHEPAKTPTIAGGLFTISRDFFTKIGTYDEGMNIWGGENLEISFRVWMCGGSLEIHPCSAVGHIFRSTSPYKWGDTPIGDILKRNAVRVAEVWMDEYKYYYYETLGFKLGNYGDISSRVELRKKLNCKSFDWYIKNVYPFIKLPKKALYSGEIRSAFLTAICIDSMGSAGGAKGQPCHGLGGNQYFRFTEDGFIGRYRSQEECLKYTDLDQKLHFNTCSNKSSTWEYTKDQQLKLKDQDLCLELSSNRQTLSLSSCKVIVQQQWTWSRKLS